MATLWFNFPQKNRLSEEGFPKQPDVDFLVPMMSREDAVAYAKEIFTILKAGRESEHHKFVWEPLHNRGGSGEKDILERAPYSQGEVSYIRNYPLKSDGFLPAADGNGSFLLAQIRTEYFWLNIRLGDEGFVPAQRINDFPEDELVYSKIVRIRETDSKELFRCLANSTNDLTIFLALIHVGLGVNYADREEPYNLLEPTMTVDEMEAELEVYMSK